MVAKREVARIAQGMVILLGIEAGDTLAEAEWLAEKCVHLRIFGDKEGNLNRSLIDIEGQALVVSQFTLLADTRKGRRPSYVRAELPEKAEPLVDAFIRSMKSSGVETQSGIFGAQMRVEIINDGPVTILLERSPPDLKQA
jgi:D-tyrosyl-tRNA(Tyr) deacylase